MNKLADNLIGAVNGAFGNLLAEHSNPLAQEMTLYFGGSPLNDVSQLRVALKNTKIKTVAIFIHGLCNTEHIWDFPVSSDGQEKGLVTPQARNYGTRMYETFGILPLFLRYNTGLNISDNATQLEKMLCNLATDLEEDLQCITLIGFSMGGLVSRLTQSIASKKRKRPLWVSRLNNAIYIGTPHEGAPLEKSVRAASKWIEKIPKTYFSIWSSQADLRSLGIKDLGIQNSRSGEYPFAKQCNHYFISGSIWKENQSLPNWLFGDSLVREYSACPSDRPATSEVANLYGINHIKLAHSEQVWEQLQAWLARDYATLSTKASQTLKSLPITPKYKENRSEQLVGSLSALTSSSQHIAKLTQTMHNSISEESFRILNRIPLISGASKPVEAIYFTTSSAVYEMIQKALEAPAVLTKSVNPSPGN